MNDNPAKRLSIIYNSIIFVSLFVFIAIFTVLLFRQYSINRRNAFDLTRKDLLQRVETTEYLLRNAAEAVIESKLWAENYMKADSAKPPPSVLLGRISHGGEDGCASLDKYPPPVDYDYGNICDMNQGRKDDAERLKEINMALWLFDIKKISHYTPPPFRWSYYHSRRGFATVYPWSLSKNTHAFSSPPEIVRDFLAGKSAPPQPIGETKRKSAESRNRWSTVFMAPPSRGIWVANASPVYDENRLIGSVSAVMNPSFLSNSVEAPDFPNGRIYIINGRGQIVASTGVNPAVQKRIHVLSDVFASPALDVVSEAVRSSRPSVRRAGGIHYFFEPLNVKGWYMIKTIPESDILFHFKHDIYYYAMLISMLMAFVTVMHILLRRFFVQPAISFVDFIRGEAVEGRAGIPAQSAIWKPWFQKISDVLALKTLTGNLPGAIFQMQPDGDGGIRISMASSGLSELAGIQPEELIRGGSALARFIPPEVMPEFMEALEASEKTMEPFTVEARIAGTSSGGRWVRYTSRPRRLENGSAVWDGIVLDITARRNAEEELKKHHDHLEELVAIRTGEIEAINRELLHEIEERKKSAEALKDREERLRTLSRQVITSQDEERARLSRELHDDLGQQLAGMLFQVVSLKGKPSVPAESIVQLEKMLKTASEGLHGICSGLKPMTLKQFGLEPALKMLIWDFMENHAKLILLDVEPCEYNVDDEKAAAIYRVCQEAIMNSIRHSGSEKIEVSLGCGEGELVLEVRDEGRGFDAAAPASMSRLGLETMSQRAALCGGRLEIISAVNKGTTVRLAVPASSGPGGHG